MEEQYLMTVLDANRQPLVIDLLQVDFIQNDGKKVIYHIGDDIYFQITTKSELETLLVSKGFDVLDRPYLVNMAKIQHYDSQLGKVYFVPNPDKTSKFATVARIKQGFVEKFITRIVSHNQQTTTEIKVESRSGIMNLLKGLIKND